MLERRIKKEIESVLAISVKVKLVEPKPSHAPKARRSASSTTENSSAYLLDSGDCRRGKIKTDHRHSRWNPNGPLTQLMKSTKGEPSCSSSKFLYSWKTAPKA